ncbi:hypothetical protein [Frankia canadensis]|uniref:hypothetical protein n=1 Tax=Frankia canadensis TaxID=1836972 RepID=UPI000C7CCBBA|nr:hypothetical protein [Frankia canadensis]
MSSSNVDGYPALTYSIDSSGRWNVLFAANGVDVILVSAVAGPADEQPPARPTLPSVADAVMAGIATQAE